MCGVCVFLSGGLVDGAPRHVEDHAWFEGDLFFGCVCVCVYVSRCDFGVVAWWMVPRGM